MEQWVWPKPALEGSALTWTPGFPEVNQRAAGGKHSAAAKNTENCRKPKIRKLEAAHSTGSLIRQEAASIYTKMHG